MEGHAEYPTNPPKKRSSTNKPWNNRKSIGQIVESRLQSLETLPLRQQMLFGFHCDANLIVYHTLRIVRVTGLFQIHVPATQHRIGRMERWIDAGTAQQFFPFDSRCVIRFDFVEFLPVALWTNLPIFMICNVVVYSRAPVITLRISLWRCSVCIIAVPVVGTSAIFSLMPDSWNDKTLLLQCARLTQKLPPCLTFAQSPPTANRTHFRSAEELCPLCSYHFQLQLY